MKTVKITCYGKTETLPYNTALEKYTEAMMWSDGSELQRYAKIVGELLSGCTECSDEY